MVLFLFESYLVHPSLRDLILLFICTIFLPISLRYHLIYYPLCCHYKFDLLQPSLFLPGLPYFSLYYMFSMSLFWFSLFQVIRVSLKKGEGRFSLIPHWCYTWEKRNTSIWVWLMLSLHPRQERKSVVERKQWKNTFIFSFCQSFSAIFFLSASIWLLIKTSQF